MNEGTGCYIREIGGEFYPYYWNESKGGVFDIETGTNFARCCNAGIREVSHGRKTYKAAYEAIRRQGCTKENGGFKGIW